MIYFILLLLILTSLYIFFIQYKVKSKEKIYCIVSGMLLLLLAGFSSIHTGINDTEMVYLPEFTLYNYKNLYIF